MKLPPRGDAGLHALRHRSRASWSSARARRATKFCCRCRWSRSTIPDNDPGPQTLLTTLDAEQNHRPAALAHEPLPGLCRHRQFHGRAVHGDRRGACSRSLRDAAKRGLAYLDDGPAPRSVAGQIAERQAMPFAKADLAIDAVPDAGRDRPRAGAARERWRRSAALPSAWRRRCRCRSSASAHGRRQLESRGILLGAVDNRDAEIKIELIRIEPATQQGAADECRVTKTCLTGLASASC